MALDLSWSSVLVKYLLIAFNILFVLTGLIITAIGQSIKDYYGDYEPLLSDGKYFSTANLLIITGILIFVIAFFGCCGAVKENYCMTVTFSSLLIIVFVLELAIGISGYLLRSETESYLKTELTKTMANYKNATHNTSVIWDEMQINFHCCGVEGPRDWRNSSIVNNTEGFIPMSCCGHEAGALGNFSCTLNSRTLYQEGCVKKFGEFVEDNASTIGLAGLGLAFIQLLGILFSCYLSRQIKKNYETV